MGSAHSPAMHRAVEMFNDIKMVELPDEALIYCAYMCKKYMGCGEVMLTAYCVYAQLAEGLTCDEEMYMADARHRDEWAEAQRTLKVVRLGGSDVDSIKVVPING